MVKDELAARLGEDLKVAMRRSDELRRSVLRMILSDVHNQEIAKGGPLGDEGALKVIASMARKNAESIEAFTKGNRPDLVAREKLELAVIQEYLPPEMPEVDLLELIRRIMQEEGAAGPPNKGKIMSRLMPELRGRADGTRVNALVSRLLEEWSQN